MIKNTKIYIIILGIFIFWLIGVPFIFSKAAPIVLENFSFNSDYRIEAKNPRLRLNIIPIATIKADKLKVLTDSTEDYIIVKKPSLTVRILPLLIGKVHIDKISVDEIDSVTTLKENLILEKDFADKIKKSNISCDGIIIKDFVFKVNQKNVQEPAMYVGKGLNYRKNGRFIRFYIDSNVFLNGQKSDFKIDLFLPKNNDINKSIINVKIANVNVSPVKDYFINYLPKDLKDMKGIVNIDIDKNHLKAFFKNTAIIMQDDAKSMILPDNLSIQSDLNLTRKTINIVNSDITGENINLNINGTITNYIDKSLPLLNLNVRLNKSKAEDIIKLMPPIKTEDIDGYKLKKYKFYGDVLGNFSVKGDIKEPAVYGNIFINNGVLIRPIPNTNGATIKLSFLGKYLNFDVNVPAGSNEKVWVKGGVELYNVKYSDMRVWSTENVDLTVAEEKVVPLHEILNFVVGPVPIMDIKGFGNIDITIKGNRQNPHIWGKFNVKNADVNFKDMPDFVLKNADAVLSFDDENAVFIMKKGSINNKPAEIKGTCTLDGKFDFDVTNKNQQLSYFYNAVKTSSMIGDLAKTIPDVKKIEGLSSIQLKVFGNIKYIEDFKINENCFYKGKLDFLNNSMEINGINVKNIKGYTNLDGMDSVSKISANIGKANMNSDLTIKDNLADLVLTISHLNLSDIITDNYKIEKNITNIFTDINLKYKGAYDKPEYDKVDFESNILGSGKDNSLQLSEGQISLKNGKLNIKNIKGYFLDTKSSFDINLKTESFGKNAVYNGLIKLKDFELPLINIFGNNNLLPEDLRSIIKAIRFEKGKINMNASIKNNLINVSTDLGGIEFTYTPLGLPVKIINGSMYAKKSFLGLNKINLLADGMPILIDGGINDFLDKQTLDIYINSKPKQDFIDKYINNNHIYPIKIRGDIVYWAKLKGTKNNLNITSEAILAPDSSFYYLGALIGDIENAIVLNLDLNVIKQNIFKIKEFSYDKMVSSLSRRQTRLNMLKAKGGFDIYNNDLIFHDLKIKTSNPTDARVFNIIFKKPNIKQGQFTSDIKINGKSSNPIISGDFRIFETNIPFLDTVMKNVSFKFNDKTIDITSSGEVFGNEIKFKGVLKNKLTKPYYVEDAEIFTKVIDLNYLTEKIKSSQVDEYQGLGSLDKLKLSDVIIKNIKLSANGIKLRNLKAEDVVASVSLNEKQLLNIDNFVFNIASGSLNGSFKYNFTNDNTQLSLKAKDINANDITYAVFDLNNQIYGDLTGSVNLSCKGTDFKKCMETLNGKTEFVVSDGKMPKLGSLEYLLKAGNLLKGGLTGLSINSIIDIITPLKTGEFSNIVGNIEINDGIANDIEISSKGKDLNLFISGTYSFADSAANMEVLGLLSKKISTMFGPLGNVSLNTLFNTIPGVDLTKDTQVLNNINKIPGIELSEKSFRKFIAEIKGNINGDNYVNSFKWIN